MALQLQQTQGQEFGPSGLNHAPGLVPDPGATAGTTRLLLEDGTWTNQLTTALTSGVGNILALSIGGASTTSVPNQSSPFSLPFIVAGSYADSASGNIFQIA